MTPTQGKKPGVGIIIGVGKPGAGPSNGPPRLSSPEQEPDADDAPMGDTSSQQCSGCCYYSDTQDCKRYPEWIPHAPTDWCGEWKGGQPHSDAGAAQAAQPPQGPSYGR